MSKSLRAEPIWKTINAIAAQAYAVAEDILANHEEEKWSTVSRLRNSANEAVFYTAQALGSISPELTDYEWNNARKNLFALQTMYIFAAKQKMTELDPALVVTIDEVSLLIDEHVKRAKRAIKDKEQAELEPWLKKHKLWQDINSKH